MISRDGHWLVSRLIAIGHLPGYQSFYAQGAVSEVKGDTWEVPGDRTRDVWLRGCIKTATVVVCSLGWVLSALLDDQGMECLEKLLWI